MSEKVYNEEIAPALLRLADKCREMGMAFTATVEFRPGIRSTTASGIADDNIEMLIPHWAGLLGGRLDNLLLRVARQVREQKLKHSCVCLVQLGIPADPRER